MINVEIEGVDNLKKYLDAQYAGITTSAVTGMQKATLGVTRDAKKNAPVDTGRLRASITPGVQIRNETVEGVVGSNVKYAPFMELGTKPFWPPISALETWARRHGTTAFVVALAIARRGLKPRLYLQKAVESNAKLIFEAIRDSVYKGLGK